MTVLLSPRDLDTHTLSDPQQLLAALQQLRQIVYHEGQQTFENWRSLIERRSFQASAQNLADYLALRRHDLRPLQLALMPWGLSSLGRSESRVLPSLDAVIATLGAVCRVEPHHLLPHPPVKAFFEGDRLLQENTEALFGPPGEQRPQPPNTQSSPPRNPQGQEASHLPRRVRIMVTLPTEAASDYLMVKDLLVRGTNCFRINCAHDSQPIWALMLAHIHQAREETGYDCRVFMDLSGPKCRTQDVVVIDPDRRIVAGDQILLTRRFPTPRLNFDFQMSCTLPQVLDYLHVGQMVWIDDGHLGTQVEACTPAGIVLRVTHVRSKGEKLQPQKGLNFPDADLCLSALTDKDRQDLDFIAAHADIIGYSFVQEAADIVLLQEELRRRSPHRDRPVAIVAKIETPKAVRNLPELIVCAAGKQPFGVMIARGDLAVELGYQRLAEMQEEILWLCEAAHIPVIWATQVLEHLVKKGIPSRAEMTDAAMAERAECVMLNKGPFLMDGVSILDDVLIRMQDHQVKKTPHLRALQSW